jgi:potassium-transporting ATPase ATP-binding subunit
MKKTVIKTFTREFITSALKQAFKKLTPQALFFNPVMFVTYIGAICTTLYFFKEWKEHAFSFFNFQIAIWLWLTVLFANFAESIAESRGKAQAASLRRTQTDTIVKVLKDGKEMKIPATELKKGDVFFCEPGDIIPADGEVIEGVASVDESAITGESAPVIRESGGDRSAVTSGTKVISDKLIIRVTAEPGKSFLDHIIRLIEGSQRQKTPNEISLNIVLSALTLLFLVAVSSAKLFADYSAKAAGQDISHIITLPVLVALFVCLIPTTISALLNAIGIAGMNRLISSNVIAKSGRAVEAAGDIDLLILDKTGTITLGNRQATEFIPIKGVMPKELAKAAQMASLSDETPEGRSIVVLAKRLFNMRAEDLDVSKSRFYPFSAATRMSGIDLLGDDGKIISSIRKGSGDAIAAHVEKLHGVFPLELNKIIDFICKEGGTPLLVSKDDKVLGVIFLKDIIKGGLKERFAQMRNMGIRTLMITGDNQLTAAAIAAEAGVDDFLAQATPEIKLQLIREEQKNGHLVGMAGDGTNDAPALAQADVGVAMNTGTQASREAGNMVDLDNNPTKIIEIVAIGKQLLMTRGALTTFSIANDVAKYFAIIPAIFGSLYALSHEIQGPLAVLNIMQLRTPQSAILSAIIFNALIIILLIPLALRGVHYKAQNAFQLLRNNLVIYGLGGLVAPFIGIKAIDMVLGAFAKIGIFQ